MCAGVTPGFSSRRHDVGVDELDLRIFRWMYPGGVWTWWGTDPRITTTEIGSQVGLDRTAVWARIRHWRRNGFWDGFEVHVNPRIFDVTQVRVEIPVLGPAQGAEVLDQLELVEGVLTAQVASGITLHGREGEIVMLYLAGEDATRLNRRLRILRRFSSTGDLEGPFHDMIPSCSHPLSPLEWRILAAVIANPNASPTRLARLVGVTLKTFAHHQAALIDHHAIFYLPKMDWSKLPGVALEVYAQTAEDADRVRAELQARYPASIPIDIKGAEGVAPDWKDSTCFAAIVPVQSPNGVHALVRDVSRIPGVRLAYAVTLGPERLYLDWVNRRIAEHVAGPLTTSPGFVPRSGARKRVASAAHTPNAGHEATAG